MKKLIFIVLLILCIGACKNKEEHMKQADRFPKEETVLFPKPKTKIRTVGILLYDNYAVLDAMGPYHVFSELMGAKVFFVGLKKGIISTSGMKVQCDTAISDIKQLDILVIPGGLTETYSLTKDSKLLNWIKAIDKHSKYTTSVCTGAWILAATGLLAHREATTHWYAKTLLKDQFGVNIGNKRYVQSGKYWTSAGVSAGIDMSLAIVKDIMGEKYAQMVMLDLEYSPEPPVKGGKPENTDPGIVNDLRGMYDGGMRLVLPGRGLKNDYEIDNKVDPVCKMPVASGTIDTAHFNSKIYGFCSGSCRSRFKQEPTAYQEPN